jgi:hypothetical protein
MVIVETYQNVLMLLKGILLVYHIAYTPHLITSAAPPPAPSTGGPPPAGCFSGPVDLFHLSSLSCHLFLPPLTPSFCGVSCFQWLASLIWTSLMVKSFKLM